MKGKSVLIKNASLVCTMNKERKILKNSSIYIENNEIVEVETSIGDADVVIDAIGMIVLPGFINTHLHTPQIFHRHCPAQQNKPIDQWINITVSINREMDEEASYYGAIVCFAELIKSGTTTTADYFYPFPRGKKGLIEATIKAANDIGIRFHSIRGSMSLSKKDGALFPDDVVEDTEEILKNSRKLIKEYHDNSPHSMIRIGLGPCTPFTSTKEDYEETANLVREMEGVILQTHTAESIMEMNYVKEKFDTSPIRLMKETNFTGPDVSLVHCNFCDKEEIKILRDTNTNVVVCPICNTRNAEDGNKIAPLTKLMENRVNISIGTDGPASNDSLNMLEEMRYLRVVSRGKEGLTYFNPSEVFDICILGGAITLNRNDIGSIEEGKSGDIVLFSLDKGLTHAGAMNKLGSLISCHAIEPEYVIINGEVVLEKGRITTIDLNRCLNEFNKLHKKIMGNASEKLGMNLCEYPTWKRSIWGR